MRLLLPEWLDAAQAEVAASGAEMPADIRPRDEVALRFSGLELEGYVLEALSIKGNSKATLVLSRLGGEPPLAEIYELQFNGLERATLDVSSAPWLGEVLGHRISEPSLRCEPDRGDGQPSESSPEILLEFFLTVTAGCITFLARDFVLSPVRKIRSTG